MLEYTKNTMEPVNYKSIKIKIKKKNSNHFDKVTSTCNKR